MCPLSLSLKKNIKSKIKKFSLKNNRAFFLASQAVSSTGNYLLNVFMAAFSLDPSQFGAFAISFIAYILALGIYRALTIDPLLYAKAGSIKFSNNFIRPAILNALIIALTIAIASYQLEGKVGHFLLMLSIGLPGLLLLDSFRFYFISMDNPFGAFSLDFIWTSVFLSGLLIMEFEGFRATSSYIFALWLLSSNLLSVSLLVIFRSILKESKYLLWYRFRGKLFFNSVFDYIVTYGAPNLFVLFLVRESSLNEVAGYRTATAILAIGAIAIASFSVSELRRFVAQQSSLVDFFWTSTRKVVSGPIFVVCLISATSPVLHNIFPVLFMGESWNYAKGFVFPLTLSYIFIALGTIPRVYFKGTDQIARLRKSSTPSFIIVGCAFLPIFQRYGLVGFTWLLAFSSALTLAVALLLLRQSRSEEYEV